MVIDRELYAWDIAPDGRVTAPVAPSRAVIRR